MDRSNHYITLPYSEYESLLKEIEELKRRKDGPKPNVEDLLISPRLYAHLFRAGIRNIADLEETTEVQWRSTIQFGKKSMAELKQLMYQYGLTFKS